MTDCPFCKIIRHQGPAEVMYQWRHGLAIVPLRPVTPGHVIVIPYAHVEDALDDPALTGTIAEYAARYASERLRTPGVNLITSVGEAATQTVKHLHWHVVPRRIDDGLPLPWTEPPPTPRRLFV